MCTTRRLSRRWLVLYPSKAPRLAAADFRRFLSSLQESAPESPKPRNHGTGQHRNRDSTARGPFPALPPRMFSVVLKLMLLDLEALLPQGHENIRGGRAGKGPR